VTGKAVAFISNKGGTGKTTACVNVAACLAQSGKKVLVMDFDPIASTTSYLGIKPEDFGDLSIQSAASGEKKIGEVIFEIEGMGMHVVPSCRGRTFEKVKKNFLTNWIKKTGKLDYDFIMMDTSPGFDYVSREVIKACDTPIAALNESVFSIENLPLLKDIASKEGKRIDCAILSTVNRRSRVSGEVVNALSSEFERAFIVPFDRQVPRSQALGVPLAYLKGRSRALRCYRSVAKFLAEGE